MKEGMEVREGNEELRSNKIKEKLASKEGRREGLREGNERFKSNEIKEKLASKEGRRGKGRVRKMRD